MANSIDKTTEELRAEIKELKQNLSEADKVLGKQLMYSRQLEEKLGQLSESGTQLHVIPEPEGDIGTLELADIIDTDVLQSMMEDFFQLTGMLGAVIDVSGKVLVAVGWSDICTKFHRCNPDTLRNCIESDTILAQGVPEGTFKSYHCKNNMWDIVTPIIVGGRHVGNVFIGQYFLEGEEPDYEFFRMQAKKYGFNEAAYIAALDRVPRFSKETVDAGMRFYSKLAGVISTLSYSSIQQSRMLDQKKRIEFDLIKAKENAEESEDRLRGFMDSATDGFMLFDSELNQIDINDVALRITKQKREEIIGRNMLEVVPDLKKSGRYDKFKEVISTGNPITFDDIVPHTKFGDIRVSLNAFKVAQGLGIILTDITERKQAEDLLKVSEERFRKLYTDTPAIMHSMDKDGRIQNVSKRWLEKLGYEEDEVIGHKSTEFLTEKSRRSAAEQYLPQFFKEGFIDNVPYQYLTKGGDVLDILLSAISEKDENGNIILSLAVLEDITERKIQEEKIRTAEEQLKNTFDLSPSIIAKANVATGYFVEVNRAVTRILGYSVEEFTSKPLMEYIHPEDRQGTVDTIAEQIKGYKITSFENRYLCKDGVYRWIAWQATAADKNGMATAIGSDITEQKLAQLKLNQSTQLLEASQSIAKLGGWELDIATNQLFWTAETYRIHDTSPEEFKPTVDAGVGFYLPESRLLVSEAMKIAIETRKGFDLELELKTTKGRRIDVRATTEVILRNGLPIKLTGIFQDITEKKQAEEKIRIAEENLKNTFDLSPSIIAKANMNVGYFTQVNKAVTKILGYSIDEFTSKPFMEFVHPDDWQNTIDIATEQLKGNEVTFFENRYLCKDGAYKWMAWHGTKPDDDGVVTTIGSDINERKQAELKLNQSTQLLEASQSIAKLGGWELDIATNQLFWTAETYRVHDTSPEEFNPTVDAGVGYFLPESRRTISDALKAAIEHGQGYDLELETLTTKGRKIDVRTTCQVTMFEGKPQKLTGIFQDISERKKAEITLKENEAQLKFAQQSAGAGLWDWDMLTNKINWSSELFSLFGVDSEQKDTTFEAWDKCMHPDDREAAHEKLNNSIRDHIQLNNEYRVVQPNGKIVWINAVGNTSYDDEGNPIRNAGICIDITERKQADEKTRTAEENLKSTFDLSPGIIAKANMNIGRFIQVNKAVTTILGYTIDEFTSKPFMEFVHQDDWQSTIDIATEQLKGNEVTFFENRYLCKDGSYKWMAWHGTKPDKDGVVTTIGSDINERKIIEQEIIETTQFYESIIEGVQDGIWVTDKNDVIFYANSAMEKIAGVSREHIQGKNILNDFPEETTGEFIKFYKQAKKERKPIWYVIKVKTPAGRNTWQNGWLIPQYQENTFTRVICTIRDVTERKLAEGSVRRLSTAVEQSPSVIAITDTKGELEYVNPKFTELTGYSSDEAIGQKSNILKSGEQDAAFYTELWKTLDSGEVWRGQFQNKKKNGELFWEAASISAILNEAGEVINFIKIGEDITQQKDTEKELNKALEKALQSDRLKSAFLANMSHEIRTPMNGILGFINLLNEPDLSPSQLDEYSAIINKSGERLLNTINDIIDISKIEAGEIVVTTSEVFINAQIQELYSFFSPEASRKGLTLFMDPSISTEELRVVTDSHKLYGVLTNLIKNAIKYTEKGSITFGYFLKNNFIEFYVKDTGIGIPKDRLNAVFNRFEQADIADTRVFEGSGLGLAISKAYAEMLGGDIWVSSDEGKGSTFSFTIPYHNNTTKELEQVSENIESKTLRVDELNLLVVEDDAVSMELLKTILKNNFLKIIFASDGIEAVEVCKNNPGIDLVLMDINMPKMNGYDATKEIRKFNKDLLIIAQTAYALPGDKEKAIEAGCNDYITKPINKKLLLEMINELLV